MIDPTDPRAALAMTKTDTKARAAEAGKQFETVFLTQTMQEMLKNAGKGAIGSSNAEQTWNSFLAEAIAKKVADSGTTGIAQSVERMLTAYGGKP
ncbi:rod-binding protein [Frigidibacter sp. MR17.14]|uniref:rod-binding protein n=1 Tax=Frigidibacter sp. MR17.14 TaxID=3126509 RepID=UPI00301306EC